MKQNLNHNQESNTIQDLLTELVTEIISLKITLPEDQIMLTEAQVFFNGGIESVIQKIRKTSYSLRTEA
jgi:hypothetical protein